jgi:hypothetical protein
MPTRDFAGDYKYLKVRRGMIDETIDSLLTSKIDD